MRRRCSARDASYPAWQANYWARLDDTLHHLLGGTRFILPDEFLEGVEGREHMVVIFPQKITTPLKIVNLLARSGEPVCACNLDGPVGLSQPTVSHHLKKLVEVGLLEREQRGKWAYFSLRPDAVEKLATVADLKGVCCS